MRRIKYLGLVALICTLTACAEAQVKRDLQHAEVSRHYKASLASAAEFNGKRDCTKRGTTTWTSFQFNESTPIIKLPNGTNAAAFCVIIPAGARALEVHSDSKGGMTYFQLMLVHPSLQFLADDFKPVKDLPKPRLSPGEGFFSGLGLNGVVVLGDDLASANYILIYVHPLSLDGAIDVQTGYRSIPVPYGPYGQVEVKFSGPM